MLGFRHTYWICHSNTILYDFLLTELFKEDVVQKKYCYSTIQKGWVTCLTVELYLPVLSTTIFTQANLITAGPWLCNCLDPTPNLSRLQPLRHRTQKLEWMNGTPTRVIAPLYEFCPSWPVPKLTPSQLIPSPMTGWSLLPTPEDF